MGINAAAIDTAGFGAPVTSAVRIGAGSIGTAQIARATVLVGELARCDVSRLSQNDFLEAHDAVARLGRLADTLRARFAGDLERRSAPDLPGGGLARRQGFGNAGAMVASITGASQANAMRSIEAGRALMPEPVVSPPQPFASPGHRFPAIAEAALAGELPVDAAGLITAGLEALTDALSGDELRRLERRLVGRSMHLAVHEVRRMVSSAVARADLAGHEQREKRHYEERFLAWKEDHTGMVTFTGRLDAVTAAPIRTVIEQVVTHDFRARRDQDQSDVDRRTVGQMRADALFAVCRHALGCTETDRSGIRTTLVVRMNLSDMNTGRGLGRVDGTDTPVSVTQLRRLAGDAGILPEVLSDEGEVLDVGRTKRMFTPTQRLALLERDGGCAKCHAPPEHCEAHHIRWWENGGETNLRNGVMLCTRCHHDIHRQGWEISIQPGHVAFIPPPHIDPTRTPQPGGLGAFTIGDYRDEVGVLDPPHEAVQRGGAPGNAAPGKAAPENAAPKDTALQHDASCEGQGRIAA